MLTCKLEKAGENGLQPLFISVDPTRDTVGQLKNYAQDFHPNIVYLTGTSEQVAKATRSFRVYFSKVMKDRNEYLFYLLPPHSFHGMSVSHNYNMRNFIAAYIVSQNLIACCWYNSALV